jgi:hypothetical protein
MSLPAKTMSKLVRQIQRVGINVAVSPWDYRIIRDNDQIRFPRDSPSTRLEIWDHEDRCVGALVEEPDQEIINDFLVDSWQQA